MLRPTQYLQYCAASLAIIEESQRQTFPYVTHCMGWPLQVQANVFSPAYFEDTVFFARHLPWTKGGSFLEVGCGTGALLIEAMRQGVLSAHGLDINPDAVRNTFDNLSLNGWTAQCTVRLSDVFSAVRDGEQFDMIFWNVPFALPEQEVAAMLQRALFDFEYRAIDRYVRQVYGYLKESGKAFLGFSQVLGDLTLLNKIANRYGRSLHPIAQTQATEGYDVTFEIYEIL